MRQILCQSRFAKSAKSLIMLSNVSKMLHISVHFERIHLTEQLIEPYFTKAHCISAHSPARYTIHLLKFFSKPGLVWDIILCWSNSICCSTFHFVNNFLSYCQYIMQHWSYLCVLCSDPHSSKCLTSWHLSITCQVANIVFKINFHSVVSVNNNIIHCAFILHRTTTHSCLY